MLCTGACRNALVWKSVDSTITLQNFRCAIRKNIMNGKAALSGSKAGILVSQSMQFSTNTIFRQSKGGNTEDEAVEGPIIRPPTNIKFPEILNVKELTKEQLEKVKRNEKRQEERAKAYTARQRAEIDQTGSKYYQPRNPLGSSTTRDLIEQRIASIQKRLEKQQRLQAVRLQKLEERQLEAEKPQVGDFKRPISACFLLAVSVFMGMEYAWNSLEGEENVIGKEQQTRAYEERIQALLDEQKRLVELDNASRTRSESAWHKLTTLLRI